MILQVLADPRQVGDDVDAEAAEQAGFRRSPESARA